MADDTQTPGSPTTPVGYGYCAWHHRHARGVRLIRVEEAGSGPSTRGNMFACRPCRQAYNLVPLADRPL
ncbi:hypothetical protein [Streptomyces phaeochromogenes]|uniref:hypothetical protein n=1 Tax=Streptomyces phaeochromogenes TaxID=1923 RepID=UPI002DD8A8DD|nr:hypothetical protein [Streptomyces phaeochromogenes]WRZ31323.1 hypothetical protein OG931_28060 [Streptomyces phaeochromogenes]